MSDKILYLDDEEENLKGFRFIFLDQFDVLLAQNTKEAEELLRQHEVKVLVVDQRMPDETGTEFIQRIRMSFPYLVCILLTGYADMEVVIEAINSGNVYRYLSKPFNETEVRHALINAQERYDLSLQNKKLIEELQRKNRDMLEKILQMERTNRALFESKVELNQRRAELEESTVNLIKSNQEIAKAKEDIEKKKALLQKVADCYPNAYISVIEEDYTVSFTGGDAFKKHSQPANEYNGKSVDEIFGEAAAFVKEKYAKAFEGNEVEFEMFFSDQYQKYQVVPLLDTGEHIQQILVVVRDITKSKKAELELFVAKERAEESDRLKTQFINNLSMQIRTPMNGIISFAKLLNKSNITADQIQEYSGIIENNSKLLLKSVDDILEISRLETEAISLNKKHLSLGDFFTSLHTFYSPRAQEKGIKLILQQGTGTDNLIVLIDGAALSKIMRALLDNALKFTKKGSVTYGFSLHQKQVKLFVKDTGIGVRHSMKEVIFKEFSQDDTEKNCGEKGLGLGLSIAQKYAELLGTEIELESQYKKGASFSLILPLDDDEETVSKEENKKTFNVLIVDDDESNLFFLMQSFKGLEEWDFTIHEAVNGYEAVERVDEHPGIGLILMDIRMPIMDGYQATEAIKEKYSHIPIIAQTAYCSAEDQQRAIAAGCDGFVSKPIVVKTLLALVRKFLENQKLSPYESFWIQE